MDVANLIVGLLTLFFTIFGIILNIKKDLYSIDLIHLHMFEDRGKEFVDFRLVNNSPKSIKIASVSFFCERHKLHILDFDPAEYDQEQDKIKAKKWEQENQSNDPFESSFELNPYNFVHHSLSEYGFYHQVIFPTVVHSDSDLQVSAYLNEIPDQLVITFSSRICTKLKFGFIPIYSRQISTVLHHQQKKI